MKSEAIWYSLVLIGVTFIPYSSTVHDDVGNTKMVEKTNRLIELASRRKVIKLTESSFKEYVRSSPRNYSFVVMFTALAPHRGCSICGTVNENFYIIANSFLLQQGNSHDLFFGVVDFDTAGEVFSQMKLTTAPVIMYFPPSGEGKQVMFEMEKYGIEPEAMKRFVTEKTGFDFKLVKPVHYMGLIVLSGGFAICFLVIYLKQENLEYFKNKTVWAVMLVSFSLFMTSGQMWNHIRGPPLYHRTPNGHHIYIHSSSQAQFVAETYIIFLLNIGFVTSVIQIIDSGYSNTESNYKIKQMYSVASLAVSSFVFSVILSIFRSKAGGYPYRGFL